MPYDEKMKIVIDREGFFEGKDPLIKTIRERYPDIYDIRGSHSVNDPIKKLENGREAQRVLRSWLTTKPGKTGKNSKPMPYVHDELTKLDQSPDHEFGECLIVSVAKSSAGFKCKFLNQKGSDSYVHHVAMAAMMEQGVLYKYADMSKVSSGKSGENALSISHLCGNGSCCRPIHLLLEKKRINDERTHCHFVLRNCKDKQQANVVRSACPHMPPCFVNLYELNKPYY